MKNDVNVIIIIIHNELSHLKIELIRESEEVENISNIQKL